MPDAAIAVHQIFPFFVFVTLSQDSDSLIAKLNRVELVASSREREILLFWSFRGVWALSSTKIPIRKDSSKSKRRIGCWEVKKWQM